MSKLSKEVAHDMLTRVAEGDEKASDELMEVLTADADGHGESCHLYQDDKRLLRADVWARFLTVSFPLAEGILSKDLAKGDQIILAIQSRDVVALKALGQQHRDDIYKMAGEIADGMLEAWEKRFFT